MKTKQVVTNIESLAPAVEARGLNRVFLLDGENVAFDSRGPYAAFASRLLDGSTAIEEQPGIAQSLYYPDGILIATIGDVWQYDATTGLTSIATLTSPTLPYAVSMNDWKWTSAYVGGRIFFNCKAYGFFELTTGPTLTERTDSDITGLPDDIISICTTNGRIAFINDTYFVWSNTLDPSDLTPGLGGAGQQRIDEIVSGTPIALSAIPGGAIVWTTEQAMVCEFVGGDNVFRFYPLRTSIHPLLGSFAVTEMPDNSLLIVNAQGLFRVENAGTPEPLTPLFNEFLRDLLLNQDTAEVCLTYSEYENRVYLALRDQTGAFTRTYVLELSLDKWGVFSREHLGIINYTAGRDSIGYVDAGGVAHRFLPKALQGRNREDASNPGSYLALDSYAEIGYMRPENLTPEADTMLEIHEVLVSNQGRPSWIDSQGDDYGLVTESTESTEDYGDITDSVENTDDYTPFQILSSRVTYSLQVVAEAFGGDSGEDGLTTVDAVLAKEGERLDAWTLISSGVYHRLRFTADENGQFFHLTHIAATFVYQGQLV